MPILALEEGIPITDPSFYASEERCPDSLIEHVFRVAPHASEDIPLLPERIAIMRQVGAILCAVSIGFVAFLLKFRMLNDFDARLEFRISADRFRDSSRRSSADTTMTARHYNSRRW
jgi:Potential Queuosine, Q, salvage protein family